MEGYATRPSVTSAPYVLGGSACGAGGAGAGAKDRQDFASDVQPGKLGCPRPRYSSAGFDEFRAPGRLKRQVAWLSSEMRLLAFLDCWEPQTPNPTWRFMGSYKWGCKSPNMGYNEL